MNETDFDDWVQQTYAETQGFTMLIVLLGLGAGASICCGRPICT
ncbi:hypothetical protein ACFSYD_09160 [Paracoccus aerius]